MKPAFDVTFHPAWWHKHAGVSFTRDFFENPQYRLECDVRMRRLLYDKFGAYGMGEKDPRPRPILGTDLLASGFLHAELLGCPVTYAENDAPQVHGGILTLDHVATFQPPNLETHPLWRVYAEQIEALQGQFGAVLPAVNLMGVQNLAFDLLGSELYMAYYDTPELVQALLGKVTDFTIAVGKRVQACGTAMSAGVTAIVSKTVPQQYLTSNCTVDMISQDFYETYLLPCDNRLAQAFGAFGIHHCGGHMERVCKGYAKVEHLCFAEVGYGSDVAAVRAALPNIPLNLRYSPVKLQTAQREEIRAEMQALLAQSAGGTASVSCVGIDAGVGDAQVEAFLQACTALEA